MTEDEIQLHEANRQLVSAAAEVSNLSSERYYEWVRQMLSLAFAGLTALVALQDNYNADSDLARLLLRCTFATLAVSVICCAAILRGDSMVLRRQSKIMAKDVSLPLDSRSSSYAGNLPKQIKFCQYILPWCLALSVLCLSVFAIVNTPSQ